MSMLGILSKLKEAWAFITEEAPNALEVVAAFFDKAAEATRDAAEWIKNLGVMKASEAHEEGNALQEFEKFREEVSEFAYQPLQDMVKARAKAKVATDVTAGLQLQLAKALSATCDCIADKYHEMCDAELQDEEEEAQNEE